MGCRSGDRSWESAGNGKALDRALQPGDGRFGCDEPEGRWGTEDAGGTEENPKRLRIHVGLQAWQVLPDHEEEEVGIPPVALAKAALHATGLLADLGPETPQGLLEFSMFPRPGGQEGAQYLVAGGRSGSHG